MRGIIPMFWQTTAEDPRVCLGLDVQSYLTAFADTFGRASDMRRLQGTVSVHICTCLVRLQEATGRSARVVIVMPAVRAPLFSTMYDECGTFGDLLLFTHKCR